MSSQRIRRTPVCGLAVIFFLGGAIASSSVSAASQEQHATGSSVNHLPDWIGPTNAEGAPDVICASSTSSVQSWIQLSFAPFVFPPGDVIKGIEVSAKHQRSLDSPVRLTIGGALSGSTGTLPLYYPGGSTTSNCTHTEFVSAGSDTDLWGLNAASLKTELEAGNLGFRITSSSTNGESYPSLFIDSVKLIVHHGPANSPPIASCQDVTVSADASCQAAVTASQVDNGSSDPDGDPLTLTLVPTGPYSLGANPVTLHVSDGINPDSTCGATVTVEDNTAPVVSLNEENLTLECALESFTDPGATATDNCDGTVAVTTGGDSVDEGTPGDYIITYDAVDSAGNPATQVTRTVTVEDTTPPEITLNGDNPMTLECAVDLYVEPGATAVDACDDPDPQVTIGGDTVDAGTPGAYTVTYDATDNAGNAASQETRSVTVQDTLPPEIMCNTPEPATIIPPDAPISFTATANDLCEGALPAVIEAYDCYWTNPSGKLVDKTSSCVVSFADDTLDIEDSGGVKDAVEWTVNAADSVPNQSAETCSVEVVSPAGKKK